MNDVRQQLKRLRRTNIHHRKFIPILSLNDALSEHVIRQVLRDTHISLYQLQELARDIFNHGRKILAILILSGQVDDVLKFVEKGDLEDAKLPFTIDALRCDIGISEADDFEEIQWEVLAPTFRQATLNRSFKDKIILPFISREALGQGAFGRVFVVKLDAKHQQLGEVFPEQFVQKELDHINDHRAELDNLSILNHLCHPNITRLLASYTHDNRHALLFPLAEHGTLAELLHTNRQDTKFENDETFLLALTGLASAVEHVHDFFEHRLEVRLIGCHHDLRPRNVLVSGTTFILADFGVSRFREASQNSATPFRQGVDDYLAPECEDFDNGFEPLPIRRSSDVWSFGCILLELATYLALGPSGVEQFRAQRHFRVRAFNLHLFHNGPGKTASSVMDWCRELETSECRSSQLLVALSKNMLNVTESDRPRAREVTSSLRLIVIFEKATKLGKLIDEVEEQSWSLDVFLERTRFSAWRHALGVLNSETLFRQSARIRDEQYQRTLNLLDELQDHLLSRLSQSEPLTLGLNGLSSFNDRLNNTLDAEQQTRCRVFFRIAVLHSDDKIMKEVAWSHAGKYLDKEIRMQVALKHMITLAETKYDADEADRQVSVSTVRVVKSFAHHDIGQFINGNQNCPVLIEWRKYGYQSADEVISQALFARLNAIVRQFSTEKPRAMRTLRCCGYFHEESRYAFGIIYQLPVPDGQNPAFPEPIHLHDLIAGTTHSMKNHPTLDDKFKLAYTLAKSIHEFHMIGWVHKSLNTNNIIFCPGHNVLREAPLTQPYIVGFNHSRPNDILAFTEGPNDSGPIWYQHPTYRRNTNRYRLEYDYYSLGIILMEIGCWMNFCEIAKCSGADYTTVHERRFMDRLPRLKQYMGKDYHDAVMACINGDIMGSETDNAREDSISLFVEFDAKVLTRLTRHLS